MIGGSVGLREFTSLRYKYRAVERIDFREEAKKKGLTTIPPEEVTLEKVYEKMKDQDIDQWENIRIPRPDGFE